MTVFSISGSAMPAAAAAHDEGLSLDEQLKAASAARYASPANFDASTGPDGKTSWKDVDWQHCDLNKIDWDGIDWTGFDPQKVDLKKLNGHIDWDGDNWKNSNFSKEVMKHSIDHYAALWFEQLMQEQDPDDPTSNPTLDTGASW